jgi:WD40 repeat protein
VSAIKVSPCGKIAATAGEDKKIRIWDLAQNKPIKVNMPAYFLLT